MFRRALLSCWLVSLPAWGEPPHSKTQVMYFSPKDEVKLSKELKRLRLPWPVMRLGIAESGKNRFAMIRVHVQEGAGRSEVARELLDCARTAFRLVPGLYQVDVDAVTQDDTAKTKAQPWMAISLRKDDWKTYRPGLVPERWLATLRRYTVASQLKPDREAIQIASDTFVGFYVESARSLPLERKKPGGTAKKPAVGKRPRQPE